LNVADYGDGTASKANFESAYADASDGDTIQFPASGSATWSATMTISKAITIDGNGTTLTAGTPLGSGLFSIASITNATQLLRITDFVFNLQTQSGSGHAISSALNSQTVDVGHLRIDNNLFILGGLVMEIGGCNGVIDGNVFSNSLAAIETHSGSVWQADESWEDMSAGTASAMFIEDNLFIDDANYPGAANQPKVDGYNGGKVVIRYNTFDFTGNPLCPDDTAYTIGLHGSAAGGVANGYWQIGTGGRRAHSVIEVYHNTMTGARIDFLYSARGSASLVWSNSLIGTSNGTGNERITLREEEQVEVQWDPLRTAWPAEDQVHNSHFWGNTFDGYAQVAANVFVYEDSADYIQLGRDYWTNAPAASGGYEYFTGANGASGSHPTDGDPHPTLGTMAFSETGANAYYGYVPYLYPHPLRGITRRITAGTIRAGTVRGP
jgi:hypothetical protein